MWIANSADLADSGDSGGAGDSGGPGDSADSGDSGDSVDVGDSGDTDESGDSGDSGDSGGPGGSGRSDDSGDSGDSGELGDSGDSGGEEAGCGLWKNAALLSGPIVERGNDFGTAAKALLAVTFGTGGAGRCFAAGRNLGRTGMALTPGVTVCAGGGNVAFGNGPMLSCVAGFGHIFS